MSADPNLDDYTSPAPSRGNIPSQAGTGKHHRTVIRQTLQEECKSRGITLTQLCLEEKSRNQTT